MSVLEKEFFLKQFQALREDNAALREDNAALRAEMNVRFDEIERHVNRVEDELSAIRTTINRYDQAIGSLYTMMIDMQHQLDQVKARSGMDAPEH